jgi:hypothetical protein
MITVQADTRGLEKAMFDFAMTSRKLLGDVVKQQTGILVGHIIATWPMYAL